jgi:pilus assembly protein CpaB
MKWKTSISLLVALVLGLVTAKVGLDMVHNTRTGTMGSGRPMKVVIAGKDLEAGHVLQASELSLRELPSDLVPASAFLHLKDAVGRTIITPVVAGQTIFEKLVAAPGTPGGLQALVPEGMRAVTVEVSESSGLAGQLAPGCHVDVIATLRDGDQSVARTIVENVKVSAIMRGRNGSRDEGSGPVRSITLIVKPKEAAAIELANAQGKPRLVLRGNSDLTSGDTSVSQNELLGKPDLPPEPVMAVKPPPEDIFDNTPPAPPPIAPAAPAPATEPVVIKRPVQIIRGSSESTIYMDPSDLNGSKLPGPTKAAGNESH